MKRLTLHWTGGGPRPSPFEKTRYHFLIAQDLERHEGDSPPEVNRTNALGQLRPDYVRHTGGFNSDCIGMALCGMAGAKEIPFQPGGYPVTREQLQEAARWTAELCTIYGISVTPYTILMHSEIGPRFGRGVYKWDVNYIAGLSRPMDPIEAGDTFRSMVRHELEVLSQAETRRRWPVWMVPLVDRASTLLERIQR